MKFLTTALLTGALAVTAVAAQANEAKHTKHVTVKPAVVTDMEVSTTNPVAPVEGRNSFTNIQAQERVAAAGYTDISALTKDDGGIWHGTAMKGGMSHMVTVDYQGNVSESK